jgi:two-component system LytT family response regulator
VADDEPLARKRLRSLLRGRPEIELTAECATGREAVAALQQSSTDLVFLDIQMPDLSGFGVLEELGAGDMPPVIFVTAFDDYALDAFEVAAVDYLLKPFDDERFEAALARGLERARERRQRPDGPRPRHWRRFAVSRGGRKLLVPVEEVDWIEGEGSYVRLHTRKRQELLLRDSLRHLEAALDPGQFVRIHRSTIVRIAAVRELRPLFHGDHRVVLHDGRELRLSRSHHHQLPRLRRG